MSVSASIDIRLFSEKIKCPRAIKVLQVLMSSGWTLVHNNYISYLPIGDKDEFDWQTKLWSNFDELENIIHAKSRSNEIVGVILSWQNTGIGGSFLFWPKNNYEKFSINLDGSRQKLFLDSNYSITDFQWYLEKLLPPLNEIFGVEFFSCEQHS